MGSPFGPTPRQTGLYTPVLSPGSAAACIWPHGTLSFYHFCTESPDLAQSFTAPGRSLTLLAVNTPPPSPYCNRFDIPNAAIPDQLAPVLLQLFRCSLRGVSASNDVGASSTLNSRTITHYRQMEGGFLFSRLLAWSSQPCFFPLEEVFTWNMPTLTKRIAIQPLTCCNIVSCSAYIELFCALLFT